MKLTNKLFLNIGTNQIDLIDETETIDNVKCIVRDGFNGKRYVGEIKPNNYKQLQKHINNYGIEQICDGTIGLWR